MLTHLLVVGDDFSVEHPPNGLLEHLVACGVDHRIQTQVDENEGGECIKPLTRQHSSHLCTCTVLDLNHLYIETVAYYRPNGSVVVGTELIVNTSTANWLPGSAKDTLQRRSCMLTALRVMPEHAFYAVTEISMFLVPGLV